ncbi:MAG: hypothetical protein ACYTGX_14455, partial [Planctomycetota bacterium]
AAASAAQVAKLQAEILVLKNERAELQQALAAAKAAAGAGAETAAPGTFRFGLSGQTPTFDKADWPKLGGHLVELAKAITTLPEAIASGKGIDMATRQKLAQHNTPLAGFAVSAAQELGGTGPNGAFTHPAVMANLMRAALEAAELPLSPEQEQHIASIGEAWSAREAERLGRYNASTPALSKTIDEVDLKQRFINDVRKTLTKAQDAVVFPPSTVGRAQLDLFSPALVYAMRQPVTATDRPGLEQQMLESLGTSLAWTPEAAAPYAYLVTEWCDALPKAMEAKPRTHPDVTFPHIDDIQAAARAQLAITQKLLALGELAQAQADALRANTTVLQPQLIKTP